MPLLSFGFLLKQRQEFHLPGSISASKIQKRFLKCFHHVNGPILGAILSQLLKMKRIKRPNAGVICLCGRAPGLRGHLVLWGRVQHELAVSLTATSVSRFTRAHRRNTTLYKRAEF